MTKEEQGYTAAESVGSEDCFDVFAGPIVRVSVKNSGLKDGASWARSYYTSFDSISHEYSNEYC